MIPLLAPDESKRRAAEVGIRQDLAGVNAFRSLLKEHFKDRHKGS